MCFIVSCLEVNTNGTVKEESPQASESRSSDKDTSTPIQQQHTPAPPPPERSNEKEKEKIDKDKSGGTHYFILVTLILKVRLFSNIDVK